MGSAYMQAGMGIENPRVALANIGAEEIKGTPLYKETHQLLKETDINFIGNLEPKELLNGCADVLVCDGFTGNIISTLEGSFLYTFGLLKKIFMSGIKTKLAAGLLKKDLYALKKTMDPSTVGGVPLLGINGGVIKAHGSSDAEAFKNAIGQAIKFQQNNVVGKLTICCKADSFCDITSMNYFCIRFM
jgi:glycerol-3-phosphate acyltransferase PlsX